MKYRKRTSRGFTLLEVLLALSLTIVIVGLLSAAIRLNGRIAEKSRGQIEQAQLARSLLNRIADDLRSSFREQPVDTSGIAAMQKNAASAALTSAAASGDKASLESAASKLTGGKSGTSAASSAASGMTSGSTKSSGSTSGSSKSGSSKSGSSASGSSATDPTASQDDGSGTGATATDPSSASKPGLYGSDTEIRQIDIASALRPGANVASSTGSGSGGLKTVSYYLKDATASGGAGLMRRELDRATAAYASSQGASSDTAGELLAEEVTGLAFRYYDGTDWLSEWDSDSQQSLPMAVEILLTLAKPGDAKDSSSTKLASADSAAPPPYRLVVQMPSYAPPDTTSTSSDTSPDSDTTDPASDADAATGESSTGSKSTGSKGSGTGRPSPRGTGGSAPTSGAPTDPNAGGPNPGFPGGAIGAPGAPGGGAPQPGGGSRGSRGGGSRGSGGGSRGGGSRGGGGGTAPVNLGPPTGVPGGAAAPVTGAKP